MCVSQKKFNGALNACNISGDEFKWDDASEAALWSLVEKYKKELYDQKNGFTRNEYLDKISRELRTLLVVSFPVSCIPFMA